MAEWKDENGVLTCSRSDSKVANIILAVMGGCMSIVAIVWYILQYEHRKANSGAPYGFLILLLFGLILLYAGMSSLGRKTDDKITFDGNSGALSYEIDGMKHPYVVQGKELAMVYVIKRPKERGTDADGRDVVKSWTYHLYLLKKDGAEFWVDSFTSEGQLALHARDVANAMNLQLKSDIDGIASLPAPEAAVDFATGEEGTSANETAGEPSVFFMEEHGENGAVFTLVKKQSASSIIATVLVMALFLILPGYMAFAGSRVGANLFMIIFIGFFMIFFIGGGAYLFIYSQKRYRITASRKGLRIDLAFAILTGLSRTVWVPREQVRSIRTNRIEDGDFTLSVAVNYAVDIPKVTTLFMKAGIFGGSDVSLRFSADETVIQLWQVSTGMKPGTEPDVLDLANIEERIQKELGLTQEKL